METFSNVTISATCEDNNNFRNVHPRMHQAVTPNYGTEPKNSELTSAWSHTHLARRSAAGSNQFSPHPVVTGQLFSTWLPLRPAKRRERHVWFWNTWSCTDLAVWLMKARKTLGAGRDRGVNVLPPKVRRDTGQEFSRSPCFHCCEGLGRNAWPRVLFV